MEYKTKTYHVDGQPMQFNKDCLARYFTDNKRIKHVNLGETEWDLAEKLNVDASTIRSWRYGKNAPSDIDMVKELAKAIGVNERHLLKAVDGGAKMERLNERQIESVKKVYDAIVEFLNEFLETDGFAATYSEFAQKGAKKPEIPTYDYIDKLEKGIQLLLEKEYFDLRGTELFTELNDFVYGDLVETYEGKASPDYRYEAAGDNDNVSTYDDYCGAMEKLNAIIEKYC